PTHTKPPATRVTQRNVQGETGVLFTGGTLLRRDQHPTKTPPALHCTPLSSRVRQPTARLRRAPRRGLQRGTRPTHTKPPATRVSTKPEEQGGGGRRAGEWEPDRERRGHLRP